MIIEIEDRFCKAAQVFSETLKKVERAAQRGVRIEKSSAGSAGQSDHARWSSAFRRSFVFSSAG